MLKDGGNAVDAAVATILAQTVTDANQFCFGGEVPFVIYDARRKVVEVLAGQGAAPRLATREYFLEHGGIKKSGIEAAAVPATLDACLTALDRHGSRTFAAGGRAGAPNPRPPRARLARRPRKHDPAARPGGERRRRSSPRPPAGRRLLLPRPDRPRDRRLVARQRRPDSLQRPGHTRHPRRRARDDDVSRLHRRQVRPLDPGPRAARSPPDARRFRPLRACAAAGPTRQSTSPSRP